MSIYSVFIYIYIYLSINIYISVNPFDHVPRTSLAVHLPQWCGFRQPRTDLIGPHFSSDPCPRCAFSHITHLQEVQSCHLEPFSELEVYFLFVLGCLTISDKDSSVNSSLISVNNIS